MIRVLVVDDDFMVAKVHCGFVERIPGFTVVGVAHTGREALQEFQRLRPDLVLLDIYLPDFSGLEVLTRLREGSAFVDVLAITAARDAATIREALRGGAVQYLIKPFTFDAFRDRLERLAATRAHLAEAESESGQLAQEDVDSLFRGYSDYQTTRRPLPKGLSRMTSELVAEILRAAEADLSAAECAQRAGISRVSTRRYLEFFVDAGLAAVKLRYGSTGRPERRYRWTTGSKAKPATR